MTSYKAWTVEKTGSIQNLKLKNYSVQPLGIGKCRIRVSHIGLNFADIFAIVGLYSATPKTPFIPGLEFSGIIEENNSENLNYTKGQKVYGISRFSAYSEIVDIEPDYIFPLKDQFSFAEAAAYLVQTLTAWMALNECGNFKSAEVTLIHSAAGGVGLQALRLCHFFKKSYIATVSSNEKKDFLLKNGFNNIVIRNDDWLIEVHNMLKNKECHLVLDAIGGKIQRDSYNLMGATGRLVCFGAAEFTPGKNGIKYLSSLIKYYRRPLYDPLKMINENKSILAFNLIWLWNRIDILNKLVTELSEIHIAPPFVGKIFPFFEAKSALEHLRSGQSIGKVVLEI